jgi:hypothetical protein
MKARHSLVLLAVLSGLAVSFFACETGSENQKTKQMKTVILPAGEVHDGWYFAAGDHVIIDGTVNGDLYAAAGKVDVNGVVNGDVLAAGGVVDIGGKVSDDVRAGGGTVRISGVVGKNVTAMGGTVEVGRSASIGGGLLAAGGTIQHAGAVKKDAMIAGGTTEITGIVEGNVDVASRQLAVYHGAQIGGNLTADLGSKEHAQIAEGTVKGSVTFKEKQEQETRHILGWRPWRFWLKILWVGGLLLTGLFFFLIARKQFADYGSIAKRELGMSLVWGLTAVIAVPVVVIILCVTLIGIPLGLILLAAYLTVLYFSQLSLGMFAGNLIFKSEGKGSWTLYWAFAVGTIIFQILTLVPILGGLLEIAAALLGFGVLVMMVRSALSSRRMAGASVVA